MSSKKEKKESKPTTKPFFSRIADFFRNEKIATFIGLVLTIFTLYLFILYISYFFTGAEDQSMLESATDIASNDSAEIHNAGGLRGAQMANYLVNRTFGAASIAVVIFLGVLGLRLMRVSLNINLWKWFIGSFLLLTWGSLFLAYVFMPFYENSFIYLGGLYGYGVSLWLEHQVGKVGVIMIIVLYGLSISIYFSARCIDWIRSAFRLEFLPKMSFKRNKKEKIIDEAEESINEVVEEDDADEVSILPEMEQTVVDLSEDAPKEDELVVDFGYTDSDEPNSNFENDNDIEEEPEEDINDSFSIAEGRKLNDDSDSKNDGEPDFSIEAKKDELYQGDLEQPYNPKLSLSNYRFPTLDLMTDYGSAEPTINEEEQNMNKQKIISTLKSFGIEIKTIKATVGPTATLYEITPVQGVRISKIRGLEDDIALSLAALGIRIIAPIPGKGTIGIEVPNANPKIVSGRSIIGSTKFQTAKYDLPIAFGKTITNDVFVVDLCKMPHVLVAGATGQGKSVGLNAIITSLLYKKHPSELKFVLIDPKKVEFSIYSAIRDHYLAQIPDAEEAIITDVTKVVHTLNSVCTLMDRRYDLLKDAKVRNIKEYNEKFINRRLNPNKGHDYMPYIVVVIDEFGDLIMTAGKEIELPIARIAQLARAVGIHMIIATQRPTTNIITGTIKANFPARVAFRVSSMMDSRTILDRPGANQLIGKGDMLFLQGADPIRVQCAFIDTPEVEQITQYIAKQPSFNGPFELPEYVPEDSGANLDDVDTTRLDALFEDAAAMVVLNQQGSTSMIQRKFSIGYNRAGRIMDQMEKMGIVGPADGSKPRQVLVMDEAALGKLLNNF